MNGSQSGRSAMTRGVVKAVGILGGAQSMTILCSLVRAKLVAVWIGAAGFGLFALFNNALSLLTLVAGLGTKSSAVREIAACEGDAGAVAMMVGVVRRWGHLLALAGVVLTVVLSPLLSRLTFGSDAYSWHFVALAAATGFNVITETNLAVLQGLRRLKQLARASVAGALGGLAISVPLFYLWRIDSIIPSILAYSLCTVIAVRLTGRGEAGARVSAAEAMARGRRLVTLGFFITLSDLLNQLAVYIFLSWLNVHADEATVGLYNSGNTLFYRYVGMVFTAIAMEYYPRLASVAASRRRTSVFVAHEIKLSLLLLMPMVTVFIAALPLIVKLLYTSDFEVIVPMATVAICGTLLRAVSWCMAMVILARGDGRTFLLTEGLSAVAVVGINIAGYTLGGLTGLGAAYVVWYAFYVTVVALVFCRRYGLRVSPSLLPAIVAVGAVTVTAAVLAMTGLRPLAWVVAAGSSAFTLRFLFRLRRSSR